jgi:non-ribosomal peptide synthetase component F
MFSVFIDYLKASNTVNSISGLKWIIASGEALQPKTVNEFNKLRIFSELPEVINLYGPTEATIDVSIYKCSQADDIKEIPIGKTIDNTKLYILSKSDQLQPWGVPGELVIAGVNLARGYLNNEELTNKKFPIIHLGGERDLRIYRTGDLAKWNSEGDIIFIGRVDNQIKIRGFRIELGEIEAKLLEYSKIKEASVILQNSNSENPVLKAFVVLFPEEKVNSDFHIRKNASFCQREN